MTRRLVFVLALLAFVAGSPVVACPSCADAIAASSTAEEPNNTPAAFNASIYLMVTVPYLCLGVVGFMIYRGCKKNAEYLQARMQTGQPAAQDNVG